MYIHKLGNIDGRGLSYLDQIWRYKELCASIVVGDLVSRFRGSIFGVLWCVIQPLAFSLLVSAVWGQIFGSEQDYLEMVIYVFSGMVVWEFFTTSIIGSLTTLQSARGYLHQTRIPLLIFQVRVALSSFVVHLIGTAALIVLMVLFGSGVGFGPHLLLIPIYWVIILMVTIPITVTFSLLSVKYRDLGYISMISVQALFFISPVIIDRDLIGSSEVSWLNVVNPAAPLLNMFRNLIVGGGGFELNDVISMLVWIPVLWILAFGATKVFGRRIVFSL
jgi:lipopolysaccharide transport system permease protein